MSYQITWTKKQRDRAKERGMSLFAFGADLPDGRVESTGPLDTKLAKQLLIFCAKVTIGATPASALVDAFVLEEDGK